MTTPPPRYLLADLILREAEGMSLREWVFARRKRLQPLSWAEIAERLGHATQGSVTVSVVTLRKWFAEDLAAERAAEEAADARGEGAEVVPLEVEEREAVLAAS